jgi:hypothetical protein
MHLRHILIKTIEALLAVDIVYLVEGEIMK